MRHFAEQDTPQNRRFFPWLSLSLARNFLPHHWQIIVIMWVSP